MKTLSFFFIVLFFANMSFSQVAEGFHHFKGKINNRYGITMGLNFQDNTISGKMFYDKVRQYINIKGEYDNNDSIYMRGYVDSAITDIFEGKYFKNTITGTWYTADKNRSYNFELSKKDDSCFITTRLTRSVYDSVKFQGQYVHFKYDLDVFYPVLFENQDIEQKVYSTLFGVKKQNDIAKMFLKDEKMDKSDWLEVMDPNLYDSSSLFSLDYSYSTTYDVLLNKNCLFSTEEADYEYTGGAHGMAVFTLYNFDLKTGDELKFNDVFTCDSTTFLQKIVIPKLEKYSVENCEGTLDETKICDTIPFPDGWGFDNFSFGFLYNEYSVFPFACSNEIFEVDYKELKPYLQTWIIKRLGL